MYLECRHISYRYPVAGGDVLCNLTFTIDTPGFHALFGASGVGKTTLAKILGGQIRDHEGQIRQNGAGRVLYTFNLERLPGWGPVAAHFEQITPPGHRQRLRDLVDAFGIQACLGSRFQRLSLGQQNRANLIRYLLQDFDLLVMDESLANVDEVTRERIVLQIKTIFPERCFVYISHNVAEVAKLCRQIIVMRSPEKTVFNGPADLRGKTIGVTFGGNDETILRAILARHGIAEQEVNLFSVRYDYTPFYLGQVDFWPLYLNAQAVIIGDKLAGAGEKYAFLSPDALGVRFVANSVVTTRQMLETRPMTVKRFVTALLAGWQEALDPKNEEAAINVLLAADPETPEDVVRRQLHLTRDLMKATPASAFGRIDVSAWKQAEQIMHDQKLISGPIDVQALLHPRPF